MSFPCPLKLLFGLTASASLLFGIAACDKGTDPPDASDFTIVPPTATVLVGQQQQFTAQRAPGSVDWSTSNAQVATVVRETGFVTAIGRGTSTVSAVSEGAVKSAVITVEIEPAIGLSAPSVEFSGLAGGAELDPQTVQITNVGDRVLSGLSLGAVQYSGGPTSGGTLPNPSWLLPNISSATAPANVTLAVVSAGLPRGVYIATIPIQSTVASNAPQSLMVTLRLQDPPSITADPNPVQLTAIPDTTVTSTVVIGNGGDVPLTGLSLSVSHQGQGGWLTAVIDGTTAPANLLLTASSSGLAVGTFAATVHLISSIAGVAPLDLSVELLVTPGPAISLGTTNVSFNALQGTSPGAVSVTVTNGGGGLLSGLTAVVTSASPWLSVSLNSQTAPTTLGLSVTSSALATGTYNATVQVASNVASNSPRNIAVTLSIGLPPEIDLNPGSLTFGSFEGATIEPNSQLVAVTNSGGGSLTNLVTSVTYFGSASGWLTPTFQGSTSAPATISVAVSTGSLGLGTYTAELRVSAPGVPSETIPITFRVQSFTSDVATLFGSCDSGSCHGSVSPILTGSAASIHSQLIGRVTPGNPNVGSLICKITGVSIGGCTITSTSMTMSSAAVDSIRAWIRRGAPFN